MTPYKTFIWFFIFYTLPFFWFAPTIIGCEPTSTVLIPTSNECEQPSTGCVPTFIECGMVSTGFKPTLLQCNTPFHQCELSTERFTTHSNTILCTAERLEKLFYARNHVLQTFPELVYERYVVLQTFPKVVYSRLCTTSACCKYVSNVLKVVKKRKIRVLAQKYFFQKSSLVVFAPKSEVLKTISSYPVKSSEFLTVKIREPPVLICFSATV